MLVQISDVMISAEDVVYVGPVCRAPDKGPKASLLDPSPGELWFEVRLRNAMSIVVKCGKVEDSVFVSHRLSFMNVVNSKLRAKS